MKYGSRERKSWKSEALGKVRRGQLISTYGVGSTITLRDGTFMIAGLDLWGHQYNVVEEPRLMQQIRSTYHPGLSRFYMPNASTENAGADIPVVRFPSMYYCPECKRLALHDEFCKRKENRCGKCNVSLIPSRFMVICQNGHADDFPYMEWVHSGNIQQDESRHDLSIEMKGESTSLSDIVISCSCGTSRSMEGAFGEKSLAFLGNCPGRMPWLPRSGDSVCKCRPRVVLKGASNVFYANTASALSIPPWSNALSQFLDDHWEAFNDPRYDSKWVETRVLEVLQKDYWQDKMMDQKREQEYRASVAYVMEKRRLELGCGDAVSQTESFANADMRFAEYGALCRGQSEDDRQIHIKGGVIYRNEFICRKPSEEIPREFSKWFDKVMIAEKLREVRAFVGFSRLYPIGGEEESGAKPAELTSGQVTWLPALVIRGEGIFLRFNEKRLREWETRNDVIERVQILERNLNATKDRRNSPDIKEKLVPRWLLAHTLAHVMIRQLAVDCGYPISSLKERLYVSAEAGKEMFGILIHTSTNDVSGSLGGLIELGEPSNLYRVLKDAIENASWCSSDPSCIESMASGNNGMNLAACHSCVLLPEISCEEFNSLLDRALLIGTLDNPDIGFFKDLLIGD